MKYQDKAFFRKLGYTVFVVLSVLLMSHIPVYGVQSGWLTMVFGNNSLFEFSDMLSGGSFGQLAMGGFGITSLIMSGIVLQLLGLIFPKIERIRNDGESGRQLFEKLTFVFAVLMTLVMGVMIMRTMDNSLIYTGGSVMMKLVPVIQWFVGTILIVYLAQSVRDKGIGNGTTIIMAFNIASRIPSEVMNVAKYDNPLHGIGIVIIMLAIVLLLAVYMQSGQIRVKLQQTRKQKSDLNTVGVLPIPVGMSSVLPIIYASSLMMIPSLLQMCLGDNKALNQILLFTDQSNWYSATTWQHWVGLGVYCFLILLLSAYASRMSFSSAEVANSMRERGDVIAGVSPGKDTEVYLERRRRKCSRVAAMFLLIIAVVPDLVFGQLGLLGFSFMGTSLIIMMAAFWDLRFRITGMTKHWNKKYRLFRKEVVKA